MKVYVSGPVTGRENGNEPAFRECAEALRKLGHEPLVPHDVVPDGSTWEEAMRHCVVWLVSCDAVCLLDGWFMSQGASLEYYVAAACGLKVLSGTRVARKSKEVSE